MTATDIEIIVAIAIISAGAVAIATVLTAIGMALK